MTNLSMETFGGFEGIFWIALAFVITFFILRGVPKKYRFLGLSTAITLMIFGISDFVESYFRNVEDIPQYLFIGKALCVLALCASVVLYIKIRLKEKI